MDIPGIRACCVAARGDTFDESATALPGALTRM